MLHWWSDFRSRFDLLSLRETIIWNNHNIRVNDKPIFYNNYNSANIVLLSDLKVDLSNTESFNLAKHNGLKDSNFLTWTGVRCAVPSHLKIRSREVKKDHVRSLQFKIGDKTFDPVLSKSRDFYSLLISCKATESRGFIKLKSKFSIDDVETKKAFSLIRTCICETYVQFFQFKILNDILPTMVSSSILWFNHSTCRSPGSLKLAYRTLCCVLGQDTFLSQCLSQPRIQV